MSEPLSWEAFERRCNQCGIRGETTQQAWRAYTNRFEVNENDIDYILSYFIFPKDVTRSKSDGAVTNVTSPSGLRRRQIAHLKLGSLRSRLVGTAASWISKKRASDIHVSATFDKQHGTTFLQNGGTSQRNPLTPLPVSTAAHENSKNASPAQSHVRHPGFGTLQFTPLALSKAVRRYSSSPTTACKLTVKELPSPEHTSHGPLPCIPQSPDLPEITKPRARSASSPPSPFLHSDELEDWGEEDLLPDTPQCLHQAHSEMDPVLPCSFSPCEDVDAVPLPTAARTPQRRQRHMQNTVVLHDPNRASSADHSYLSSASGTSVPHRLSLDPLQCATQSSGSDVHEMMRSPNFSHAQQPHSRGKEVVHGEDQSLELSRSCGTSRRSNTDDTSVSDRIAVPSRSKHEGTHHSGQPSSLKAREGQTCSAKVSTASQAGGEHSAHVPTPTIATLIPTPEPEHPRRHASTAPADPPVPGLDCKSHVNDASPCAIASRRPDASVNPVVPVTLINQDMHASRPGICPAVSVDSAMPVTLISDLHASRPSHIPSPRPHGNSLSKPEATTAQPSALPSPSNGSHYLEQAVGEARAQNSSTTAVGTGAAPPESPALPSITASSRGNASHLLMPECAIPKPPLLPAEALDREARCQPHGTALAGPSCADEPRSAAEARLSQRVSRSSTAGGAQRLSDVAVQSSGPPSAAPSISEDASPATLSPATVSLLHTLQGFRVKECPTRKAKEGPAGAPSPRNAGAKQAPADATTSTSRSQKHALQSRLPTPSASSQSPSPQSTYPASSDELPVHDSSNPEHNSPISARQGRAPPSGMPWGSGSPSSPWTPLAARTCEVTETPCLGKPVNRVVAMADQNSTIQPRGLTFRMGVLDTPSFSGSMHMTPWTGPSPESADLLPAEALSDAASHRVSLQRSLPDNTQSLHLGLQPTHVDGADHHHVDLEPALSGTRAADVRHGSRDASSRAQTITGRNADRNHNSRGLAAAVNIAPGGQSVGPVELAASHNDGRVPEERFELEERASAPSDTGTMSGVVQLSHSSILGRNSSDTQLSCSAHFSFSAASSSTQTGEAMHSVGPCVIAAAPGNAGPAPTAVADQAVAGGPFSRAYTSTFQIPADSLNGTDSSEGRRRNVTDQHVGRSNDRRVAQAGGSKPQSPAQGAPHDAAVQVWLSDDGLDGRGVIDPASHRTTVRPDKNFNSMQHSMCAAHQTKALTGDSKPDALGERRPANSGGRRRGSSMGSSSRKPTTPWRPHAAWRPACCAENCSTIFQPAPPVVTPHERSASRSSSQPPDPFQHFGQCLPGALPEARAARLRSEGPGPSRRSSSGCAPRRKSGKPAITVAIGNELTERSQQAGAVGAGRLHRTHGSCSEQGSRPSSAQSATFAAMVPPESSGGQGVGFVFEAQREESPGVGRRRLESLPTHEDRIRRQPRETVPHDHERLFAGFMEWREVSYFTLQRVKAQVPHEAGVYEWGALPPNCRSPRDIVTFYVGKAGSYATGSSQTLASRFIRYTQLQDGLVGPWRTGREPIKTQIFRVLQKRGFRLHFRWRVVQSPLEPSTVEDWLLRQLDYAGNERGNHGYRQLKLPGGRVLHSYPPLHHL